MVEYILRVSLLNDLEVKFSVKEPENVIAIETRYGFVIS